MRFIFIVLFLVSFGSVSMGGVGDVYYCETTNMLMIDEHKFMEILNQDTEKFKFKLEKSLINVVADFPIKGLYTFEMSDAKENYFSAYNKNAGGIITYKKGTLYITSISFNGAVAISAKCDKF